MIGSKRKKDSDAPKRSWRVPDDKPYVPVNPIFNELCAKALCSWTCGADPQEIADWLLTQQDRCPVALGDMVFALRGLKPFRRDGPLSGLGSAFVAPRPLNEADLMPQPTTAAVALLEEAPPLVEAAELDPSLTKLDKDLEGWELFG